MSKRRVVDPSMLAGLVEGAQTQEAPKGSRKSIDPKFPVFGTPVGEDILVYFPRTNLIQGENGDVMQMLPALIHEAKIGKQFTSFRCISGLVGGFYDQLGYDGECPACAGMSEVWDLYNAKMAAEAKRLGIDLQNDTTDAMKPTREILLREMDLKNPEEFVTFPICIIPQKAKFVPTDDAIDNIEVKFVHWRKKRYGDKIEDGLAQLMENPGHPAGMFWLWKFTYDTEGKQATAMAAAKNAKYTPINKGDAERYQGFIAKCEELAKEFTIMKATEVVVANQWMFKEDLEAEVNKVLSKTRSQLETIKVGAIPAGQPALGGGQPLIGGSTGEALANFGVAGQQPVAMGSVDPTQQLVGQQPAQSFGAGQQPAQNFGAGQPAQNFGAGQPAQNLGQQPANFGQ